MTIIKFNNDKKLKLGLFNAGSLGTRHDEFLVAMARFDFTVMAVNETWLREGEEGRAPAVPGYRLRHIPRPASIRTRGGGVGFYIKRNIRARVLSCPPAPQVEQMWLCLTLSNRKIVVGTAYRPPWLSVNVFLSAVSDSLASFSWCDGIVLLGDFNINLLKPNEVDSKKLYEILTCFQITQCVTEPTHFTQNSETLIDVVCTDIKDFTITVNHIPDLGAHALVTCQLKLIKYRPIRATVYRRNLKDIDIEAFCSDLSSVDSAHIDSICNVNGMVNGFSEAVLTLFDRHAPIKRVSIKQHHYPWITFNIQQMMRRRDEAHTRAKRSGQESHKMFYKELKHVINEATHKEKQIYFDQYINKSNDAKKLWSHIKQNVRLKQKLELPNHGVFRDPDAINKHFMNVPGSDTVPTSSLTHFQSNCTTDASFELCVCTARDVEKVIQSLKSNATGIDGISLDMLSLMLPDMLGTITAIINRSIETSTYPDLWKEAIIRPLPKSSNPSTLKDLRPISILPCISKVLEKIVSAQVTKFLENNNILPPVQSGFRKGFSTTTAMLQVVDDIMSAQDVGEGTILTLLDFTRAFDCICIPLLLSKLHYYGFSVATIKWFDSYFKNRTQRVEICDESGSTLVSDPAEVFRGVPQGSILGPILFILYSADVTSEIRYCKYHIYADDIQVYIHTKPADAQAAINKLNEDLLRISTWSQLNALVLNGNKSKFMILGTRKQVDRISVLVKDVIVSGERIGRVKEARNLGLLMDEQLHFESHVLSVVRSCFYRLKTLYQIRRYVNAVNRIRLCDSLVLSKFNYMDVVYGPRLLARTQQLIQRVQNACARYCFDIPPRTHVTSYINSANILKMRSRRDLHLAAMVFGIVKTNSPSYLAGRLLWSRDVNLFETRSSSFLLSVPHHHTTAFRGSFKFAATKCWNDLPPPLRDLNTIGAFKRKFKFVLLQSQKECEF